MEIIEKVIAFMGSAFWPTVLAFIWEGLGRVVPTEKPAGLIAFLGVLFEKLAIIFKALAKPGQVLK